MPVVAASDLRLVRPRGSFGPPWSRAVSSLRLFLEAMSEGLREAHAARARYPFVDW